MSLTVVKPFTLTLRGGEQKQFAVGDEVGEEYADHWYVRVHCQAKSKKAKESTGGADADALRRLETENAQLRADRDKLAAEVERLRAEAASIPPVTAAADQKKKDAGGKKDDKDPSAK